MLKEKILNIINKDILRKVFIFLSFPFVIFILLYFDFNFLGFYLYKLVKIFIDNLYDFLNGINAVQNMSEVVKSFVFHGIFKSVAIFFYVLPYIVVWFFILNVMKECGYLKNVANATKIIFKFTGVSSSDIYALLSGFGCCACVHFDTKIFKEKLLLYFLIPFFSCSAKFPVYILLAAVFAPNHREIIVFSLYILGILIGFILTSIINILWVKNVPVDNFEYDSQFKIPSFKNILVQSLFQVQNFVKKTFIWIFISLILIWFLLNFNLNLNFIQKSTENILMFLGRLIFPLFQSFGVENSRISSIVFAGFFSKEAVGVAFPSLFSNMEEIAYNSKRVSMLACMLFVLIYTPCFAMIVNIKRELGVKYALLLPILQCSFAFGFAFITYLIGKYIYIHFMFKPIKRIFIC